MPLRLIAFIVLLCASGVAQAQSPRDALAPTGVLRIGVYPGSPSSMIGDPKGSDAHGVTVEVGRALAAKLGVASELVVFPRVADVVDAIKTGAVDFTITNATPARAQDVDFGPNLLDFELGFLVAQSSPLQTSDDVRAAKLRIGVTKGSTSERTLPPLLPNATLVPAANLKEATDMLGRGDIDAYATNKPTLFEMSDHLSGSRVLTGRWGLEHLAAAIPRQHSSGLDYVSRFSAEARASGLVTKAAERAGMRGLASE
jgi:polar amino acid transport system substrate-binding protein